MESGISKSKARFCTQSKCGTWMHYSRDPVVACFEGVTTFISTSYALPLGSSHMRVEAGNPHRNMCVKQCHKPPMTGNGLDIPTYTNWDDSGDGTNGISQLDQHFDTFIVQRIHWVFSKFVDPGLYESGAVLVEVSEMILRCWMQRLRPHLYPKRPSLPCDFQWIWGDLPRGSDESRQKKWFNWILLPEILMM